MADGTLKKALLTRHPWWSEHTAREEWPTMRAVLGGLNRDGIKREMLVKGKFEKKAHFTSRVRLTQFLGVTEGIIGRVVSAVFRDSAHVKYGKDSAALQEWAEGDVDGKGHTLGEWLEERSEEALGMGLAGTFVDMTTADPVELEKDARRLTADDDRRLGIKPRLLPFRVEELTNWGEKDDGTLAFVILQRTILEQEGFEGAPVVWVEWLVMDATTVRRYRAKVKTGTTFDKAEKGANGLPLVRQESEIGAVDEEGQPVDHNCGCVPFAPLYGGRIRGTLRATTLMQGTGRADIAILNEESASRWSRYLHLVPLLWVKTRKKLSQVFRTDGHAVHLDPSESEDVGYATTDAAAFSVSLDAVKEGRREAHRQSGTDPAMAVDGQAGGPESGTAKARRFATTEARLLSRFAKHMAESHEAILEMAARRLSPDTPARDARLFSGTVQYPTRFDVADIREVMGEYADSARVVDSIAWHREMRLRIALGVLGDAPSELREKVQQEMEAVKDEEILAAIAQSKGPASGLEPDGPNVPPDPESGLGTE